MLSHDIGVGLHVNPMQYKIELRMRNHNTLSKATIIEQLAQCVPPEHKVKLEDPELFILVEIWKVNCARSTDVFDIYNTIHRAYAESAS